MFEPLATQYQRVTSVEELRGLYRQPDEGAVRKCLPHLDVHSRMYIAHSPFVVIATFDGVGSADASPRGDPPGFVAVLDDHHLLIPDRPGNNRLDSMVNILRCPHVGILFFIPGVREVLRVNGMAAIVRDERLLQPLAIGGRVPPTGILVQVREMFLHCAKSIMRSRLWEPAQWPPREALPSAGTMLADHVRMNLTAADLDSLLEEGQKKLY